ncbi:hypothetical protein JG688_00013341 [Phytophthora aleatoria]|uniref:Uncharacterized protein n=1 Tax=Phytophthora aleatoria TaxID=2496075 RepID=A0A8J5IJ11_9STRA|nr:hypothetical protein JG688_00013341 [Phytophthora aleatoria]
MDELLEAPAGSATAAVPSHMNAMPAMAPVGAMCVMPFDVGAPAGSATAGGQSLSAPLPTTRRDYHAQWVPVREVLAVWKPLAGNTTDGGRRTTKSEAVSTPTDGPAHIKPVSVVTAMPPQAELFVVANTQAGLTTSSATPFVEATLPCLATAGELLVVPMNVGDTG